MFVSFRMVLCESSMLLFESTWCYAKPRRYCSSPCGVMRNLDAIIRVRVVLCETSMLLFVFRIRYVRLNPGLQRARPLWSGASDKLCIYFPRKENLRCSRKAARWRKLWIVFEHGLMQFCNNLPHQTWILIARNQFFYNVETLYNTIVRFDGVHGIDGNINI